MSEIKFMRSIAKEQRQNSFDDVLVDREGSTLRLPRKANEIYERQWGRGAHTEAFSERPRRKYLKLLGFNGFCALVTASLPGCDNCMDGATSIASSPMRAFGRWRIISLPDDIPTAIVVQVGETSMDRRGSGYLAAWVTCHTQVPIWINGGTGIIAWERSFQSITMKVFCFETFTL